VVRIHVTFLLFLVWIGAAQWRVGGREAALEGVVFLVLIFACVLAHEFGAHLRGPALRHPHA
jgi:hypothetical protein